MERATWTIMALALAAFAWTCGGGDSGSVPPKDAVDTPPGDIAIPDACECRSDDDCSGAVKVDQCTRAACNACLCEAVPRDEGVACDDGNPKTIGDACDGKGECKGTPVDCGDGKCEPQGGENCGNCEQDCKCEQGLFCHQDECVPEPVCGDGKCEYDEDCLTCGKDCKCKQGQACNEGACLACADYCQATDKECGLSEGCDCGKCPDGYSCDAFNQCYQSDVCGNDTCEASEDCSNCPADCGCPSGQKCVSGKCEDCAPICEAAGKECGFYEGCDCGSCGVCYKCTMNQCQPKCECLCYNKECGEVAGCECGTCPQGQECYGNKCLVGCDTLCAGVECGWAEDCFCDWCDDCGQCFDGTCGAGADVDEYDSASFNDYPETATDLGQTTDDDVESAGELDGSIDICNSYVCDVDWYVLKVEDTAGHSLVPYVELVGLAQDKDLDLEVCFVCDNGELIGVTPKPLDAVVETETTLQNARCFASLNLWGFDELVELTQITCSGNGTDDSGTVYIHVVPAFQEDCGSAYTLRWHM